MGKYRVIVSSIASVVVDAKSEEDAREQAHALISMPTWRSNHAWEVETAREENQ